MEHTVATDIEQLAASVQQPAEQVCRVMELLDAGFSIAYLARYRCEDTGGSDEASLTQLAAAIGDARRLADRKQVVLRGITHQNQLTAEIEQSVRAAPDLRQLEDIYLPFKRRKRSREEVAQRDLLAPLLQSILAADPRVNVTTEIAELAAGPAAAGVDDLQRGLQEMIGEHFLQQTTVRRAVRQELELHSVLISEQFHDPDAETEDTHEAGEGEAPPVETAECEHGDVEEATPSDAAAAAADDVGERDEGTTADAPAEPEPVHAETIASQPSEDLPLELAESATLVPAERAAEASPAPDGARPVLEQPLHERAAEAVDKLRRTALSVAELRREQRRAARQKRRRRLAATFRPYFQFRKTVAKISPSEWTSLDQGERLRVLSIRYEFRWEPLANACEPLVVTADHPHRELLRQSLRDGLRREADALAREVQRELVARAELRCLDGQCRKLQRLLMRRPMAVPVLAIEPKIRRESTLVVLDAHGKLVRDLSVNLSNPESVDVARQQVREVLNEHEIRHVALGDNPGWKDAVQFLGHLQTEPTDSSPIRWTLIRSGGTGLRARSVVGARDLQSRPEHIRRAVSIGRRLQDPLVEFTRVEAERLARLLFSEETKSELFDRRMEHAVRQCVAETGLNVNEADESLLRYVPGLNQAYAQKLALARKEAGRLTSREDILKVPGVDAQALQQAVAFLVVPGSENPFDVTPVHPSHEVFARSLLAAAGISDEEFAERVRAFSETSPAQPEIPDAWQTALRGVDLASLAGKLEVSPHLLSVVRDQLLQWGAWTRQQLEPPPFVEGPLDWSQIRRYQPVVGTVTNIVPFGAFVDLGHGLVGLLHVSRLSEEFVADPRELIDEGEQLSLWVGDVDLDKRKISLSFVPPRSREDPSARPSRDARAPRRSHPPAGGGGRRHQATTKFTPRPKRPPPPVVPITDAMKDGKEPMRTFSDLMQFYEQQQKGTEPPSRSKNKGRND